jgi:hypothetical protein
LTAAGYTAPDNTTIAALQVLLEADITVDISTTPWNLVARQKGTATVLWRKALTQADGSNVTSVDHLVANQIHTEA